MEKADEPLRIFIFHGDFVEIDQKSGGSSSHDNNTTRFTEIGFLWRNWAARTRGLNPILLSCTETQWKQQILQATLSKSPSNKQQVNLPALAAKVVCSFNRPGSG